MRAFPNLPRELYIGQTQISLKSKSRAERIQTSATLGTARISEKAKSEGCEVASTITVAREEPLWAEACLTNASMSSACLCSMSMVEEERQARSTDERNK